MNKDKNVKLKCLKKPRVKVLKLMKNTTKKMKQECQIIAYFMKEDKKSTGSGKTMVEFFSEAIWFKVWRYRSWRAAGEVWMMSAASLSALEALCSPSAART